MLEFEPPYLAIASPNGYAIFDTEHEMRERVQREKRVIHMKFFKGNLYLLTPDGLEIDNTKTVELISGRFSHLLTVDKNAPLVPVNAVMIKEIQDRTVTVVDTLGNSTTIGIPQAETNAPRSLIVDVVQAENPLAAASDIFDAGASEEDVKRLMLVFMNDMGWDAVDPYLTPAERAISEFTMNSEARQLQDEFNEFVLNEVET
jgi:hypothetical protein